MVDGGVLPLNVENGALGCSMSGLNLIAAHHPNPNILFTLVETVGARA